MHEKARLSLERLTPPRIIPIRAVGRPRSYARCRQRTKLPSVLLTVHLFWHIWLASSPPRSLWKQGHNAHCEIHGYIHRQSMEDEARGNIICGVHSQCWVGRSEVWVNHRLSPASHLKRAYAFAILSFQPCINQDQRHGQGPFGASIRTTIHKVFRPFEVPNLQCLSLVSLNTISSIV